MLQKPANAQVTASEQKLNSTPADKPAWKGHQGMEQVTSTRMPLSQRACPVANLENKPDRQGMPQITSTKCDLSRKAGMPYSPVSRTTPETDL